MHGVRHGFVTLLGVGSAGTLIWVSGRIRGTGGGGYWASLGVAVVAGLLLTLAQARPASPPPRPVVPFSTVLVGIVPVLIAAGWIVAAGSPHGLVARNVQAWSSDLGIRAVVDQLARSAALVAFGLGVLLGVGLDAPAAAPAWPSPAEQAGTPVAGSMRRQRKRLLRARRSGGAADPAQKRPRTLAGLREMDDASSGRGHF